MNNLDTIRQVGPNGVNTVQASSKSEQRNAPVVETRLDFDPKLSLNISKQHLPQILNLFNSLNENIANNKPIAPLPQNLSSWDKFRYNFVNGPDWFKAFRSHFTMSLNYVGIALNSLAVIGKSFLPEKIYQQIDEKSEWFSKYIIPISFGWNSLEALVGHRIPEALSRVIPAISFWALPFYNFNLATGMSSALNYVFEHVKERHGGKNPAAGNMTENLKQVFSTSVDVIKDTFTGNQKHEDIYKQLGTAGLLLGSFGGMLFARNDRDSGLARLFGNLRNFGGLFADFKLIFNKAKDPDQSNYQREVGAACSIASILNIFMRWVSPEIARMMNHISIAADDYGLTRWAQVSKEDNDRELKKTMQFLHAV